MKREFTRSCLDKYIRKGRQRPFYYKREPMKRNCTLEDLDSYIAVEKNGIVSLNTETPCDDCIFAGVNCYENQKTWIRSEAEPSRKGK